MKLSSPVFCFLLGAAAGPACLAQAPKPGQPPTPNEVIYLPELPSAESLSHSADSQGLKIVSIHQVNGSEFVAYHFENGPDSVIEYRVLPAGAGVSGNTSGGPPPPAAQASPQNPYSPQNASAPEGESQAETSTAAVPVPSTPAPAVVYAGAPATTYYYDTYPYPDYYDYGYYPWGWYGVGFGGWWGGWGGWGYRGGYGYRGGWGGGFSRGGGGRR